MSVHAQGELLGQVSPGVTTPVLLYEAMSLRTEITLIYVGVITGSITVSLYHNDSGTSFTSANLLYSRVLNTNAAADFTPFFQAQHPGSGIHVKPGGAIGIAISSADDATISAYGITETIAADRAPALRGRS